MLLLMVVLSTFSGLFAAVDAQAIIIALIAAAGGGLGSLLYTGRAQRDDIIVRAAKGSQEMIHKELKYFQEQLVVERERSAKLEAHLEQAEKSLERLDRDLMKAQERIATLMAVIDRRERPSDPLLGGRRRTDPPLEEGTAPA